MGLSDVLRRIERLEAALLERLDQVAARAERIEQGLDWFLDDPPREHEADDVAPAQSSGKSSRPKDRRYDYGNPVRLKELRRPAWDEGRAARDEEQPKSSNRYRDTRGGYRNAWFGGWQERDDELRAKPQDT